MLGASGAVYVGLHLGFAPDQRVRRVVRAGQRPDRPAKRGSPRCRGLPGRGGDRGGDQPVRGLPELLGAYCPDAMVLVDDRGTVRKAPLAELMPLPLAAPRGVPTGRWPRPSVEERR